MSSITASQKEASNFIEFVNNSPSPFHAVEEARLRLSAAGYKELKERESWDSVLELNGKYYFTRNKSTIVAFAIGGKYKKGNGVSIVGAHTDSPCLKLKPISKKEKVGYLQVGVETYGGGLWNTWFDRDLSVAGRVMVATDDGKLINKLVRIRQPILRIPTLAIHLDREIDAGFKFNKETHLSPLIATITKDLLLTKAEKSEKNENTADPSISKHQPVLMKTLAKELDVNAEQIRDFELCLYDTHPSTIGGVYNEFIFSARLDNLVMSYTALAALIQSTTDPNSLSNEHNIRMIALFDNEEVGSTTAQGANSSLLETTIRRLVFSNIGGNIQETTSCAIFEETVHKSFLISADMAHAVHPNYSERYEANHQPEMHKGVVIKVNANQRYATTAATSILLREVAKKRNIPLQEFVVRADTPCGSTIGPMISAKLGIRTIDVGNPQLSMHSIREIAGTDDVEHAIHLFKTYFEEFHEIDQRVIVD
ncbi:10460_t:CDS:2 [Ambispora leptoticha]|uniref:aspartyl aminopeptidase n=1 Tax=Ambispora leptoticha TaxID=144679 RepID=A0A9N8ZUU3_9GLOM|nr:10460_t:CDS:2 [Ambispora leptoticha]